jgi:hypothetical protein
VFEAYSPLGHAVHVIEFQTALDVPAPFVYIVINYYKQL